MPNMQLNITLPSNRTEFLAKLREKWVKTDQSIKQ
jgi:hypothetical protein